MSLMPVDEALAQILGSARTLSGEQVAIAEAAGRVLAQPITAGRDQPPFPASAMDGYAMAAADAREGAALTVIGVSQAGRRYEGRVTRGNCVRIFTGAPLPEGADCVIMQEEVDREGDVARVRTGAEAGRNVRAQANDFARGEVLLPAGTLLTPPALALAAAANAAHCTVTRRPRVALVATGDELVLPGAEPGPDQIVASNSIGLAALIARWGGEPVDLGILPDQPDALAAAFSRVLEDGADVLVTTGGASVGAHDHVQDALVAAGVDIGLWRIAMRPGKPMMFGTRGDALVFGLPGNPVSALATAQVMLVPTLCALLGHRARTSRTLPLAAPLPPNGPRRHFIRARLTATPDGLEAIAPASETDSAHLSSLARCDGFIDQAAHDPGQPQGAPVRFLPL